MYVKNVFKSGDFVVPVPVGLPATLQYNDRGVISKVYVGYDENNVDVTDTLLSVVKSAKLVVNKIGVEQGATWVQGVFYTSQVFPGNGPLPNAIQEDLLNLLLDNPQLFTFWASGVDSQAAQFTGYASIQKWLNMSGFNPLPGWVVSADLSAGAFESAVNRYCKEFQPVLIQNYFVYRLAEKFLVSTGIQQYVVKKVNKKLDKSGNIMGQVLHAGEDVDSTYSYADIVRFNIQPNDVVILDGYGAIRHAQSLDNKNREHRASAIECTVCGKRFDVPREGAVQCPDSHCLSRMYPDICHLLNVLKLPVLSYDRYTQAIKSKEITGIEDVFSLPEHQAVDVQVSLSTLIEGIIPVEVLRNSNDIRKLVNSCNNSWKSVQYYMNHTERISTDLDISLKPAVVSWLSDPYNLATIDAILGCTNIHLCEVVRKFDGPPMFRNTCILITGEFRRGSIDEITAILHSYDATVVQEFTEQVKFIVVGDIRTNVNGKALIAGRGFNIPIFDESAFFERFEIDDDLRENLE